MDYITVEQFKKQPEKVQKVLGKWHSEYHKIRDIGIPIMYETELRHFIEEKTSGKVEPRLTIQEGKYYIDIIKDIELIKSLDSDSEDLLQVYWQVACKIAEED